MQILEYILANYTWFLFGIVLILLAIIGYYADKTNFGKDKKAKPNENKQDNSEAAINGNIESPDKVIDKQTDTIANSNVSTESLVIESQNDDNIEYTNNIGDTNQIDAKIENNTNENIGPQNIELIPDELPSQKNEVKEAEPEDMLQINEEKFNMFSEEFESLLPKKNIISTDLLSDIDDLELDKTQKIDLSSVPDLDDIDLPKIMELTPENEDIWKF